MTPTHVAYLALAGATGTLLRVACAALAARWVGPAYPWGTLAVNVLGSFAFGAVVSWTRVRGGLPPDLETILLVGLLGGFTSYSSFAFQSVEMLESGRPMVAVGYMVATNALALGAVWMGLRLFDP